MTSICFSIDGRRKIPPPPGAMGACPMPIKALTCRYLIQEFEERGRSIHSGTGTTLWVILEHCRQNNIPFTLEARPGQGYTVTRLQGDPT